MRRSRIRTDYRRVGRPLLVLALIAPLLLPTAPARADQDGQEAIDEDRRVVVVRGGHDRPFLVTGVGGHGAYLGVQMLALTPELREHFGVPREVGVMISRISEDSPAEQAGVEVGDIVTAVDGESVDSPGALARRIAGREEGETVRLEVSREGEALTIEATLEKRARPVVDIRHFGIHGDELEALELPEIHLEIAALERERLNEAVERLNEELSSPEWQERIHAFRDHQSALKEHIEKLEQRLAELEQRLEKLPED